MEDEAFATYVEARWTSLVRSLVLLGCEPHEAEDVTQTALIRCYRTWDRVSRADDPDAYVYRTLLNCWRTSRRRKWWGERPSETLPERVGAATDDVELRQVIEATLGGLNADHRAVLVLRYVADLTEAQTARVLDVPVGHGEESYGAGTWPPVDVASTEGGADMSVPDGTGILDDLRDRVAGGTGSGLQDHPGRCTRPAGDDDVGVRVTLAASTGHGRRARSARWFAVRDRERARSWTCRQRRARGAVVGSRRGAAPPRPSRSTCDDVTRT